MMLNDVVMPKLEHYPSEAGWDIVKACNIFRAYRGLASVTPEEFWSKFDHRFWASLYMYPRAVGFISALIELVGVENICLVTSPTLNSECASGKMLWIQKYLPTFGKQFLIGPSKRFLANSNTILIDDNDTNCESFVKAGGRAILFPRPWNTAEYNEFPYNYVLLKLKAML